MFSDLKGLSILTNLLFAICSDHIHLKFSNVLCKSVDLAVLAAELFVHLLNIHFQLPDFFLSLSQK